MDALRSLWEGRMPLARTFWEYAIVWGFCLNLITTIACLGLLAAGVDEAIAVPVFFLALPYNLFVLVAVWRAAARYEGPPHWAQAARIAVVLWVVAATVA